MKKIVSIMVVASVVLGAFAGSEAVAGKKKKKPRTETASYSGPAVGYPGFGGVCFPGTAGCAEFATGSKERYMAIEITDSSGTPAPAWVTQDIDGDNQVDTDYVVCGTSDELMLIEPGVSVTVYIYATPAPNCAGVATEGTMKARFSAKPFKL